MKLQITPTPAGTGYRAECLDLPGSSPVGEGTTVRQAIGRWLNLLTDAQLDALVRDKPIPPAPPPAVGVPVQVVEEVRAMCHGFAVGIALHAEEGSPINLGANMNHPPKTLGA